MADKAARLWWRKKRWWAVGVVLLGVLSQAVPYVVTGGLHVADKPGQAPLSESFHGPLHMTLAQGWQDYFLLEKWLTWRALRKFPTLESCLTPDGRNPVNMTRFNWTALRTETQAYLCLHHAAAHLRDPQAIKEWLTGEGFRISSVTKKEQSWPPHHVISIRGYLNVPLLFFLNPEPFSPFSFFLLNMLADPFFYFLEVPPPPLVIEVIVTTEGKPIHVSFSRSLALM
ncbi:hypothetical protein ACLB6G_08250 [Zhengella sp. ZM62]|uniref:hypothetical protein n=1 Tax=Zhengella sedimenti TaxID=3390035 RepID=UPI0039763F71